MLRNASHASKFAIPVRILLPVLAMAALAGHRRIAQVSSRPASSFPFNTVKHESEIAFADDGTVVWSSARSDTAVALGDELDIYTATYNPTTKTFSEPVNMGIGINSAPDPNEPLRNGMDIEPFISADGLRLYFRSNRLAVSSECAKIYGSPCQPDTHWGGGASTKMFVSHRASPQAPWDAPKPLPYPINTETGGEHCPMELRDGKTLCFTSARPGGYGDMDIWCAVRHEANGTYGEPFNMGAPINSPFTETHFAQHPTQGHVSFVSTRTDEMGDIWTARPDGRGGWLPPVRWDVCEKGVWEACPAFAPDGETVFYFSTNVMQGSDPYTTDIHAIPNPIK